MKSRFLTFSLLVAAALIPNLFVSCASDDDPGNYKLEQRLDRRNDKYSNSIERRSMRRKARDDRYDAWFDMVMQ